MRLRQQGGRPVRNNAYDAADFGISSFGFLLTFAL